MSGIGQPPQDEVPTGRAAPWRQPPPLIVTLSFRGSAQDGFEAERRMHFPASRNMVPAHVTLFHALPGEAEAEAVSLVAAIAGAGPFEIAVTGLRFLGRGVAYTLASDALSTRRARLASAFAGRLSAQDAAPWRPHLTIQNKADPKTARALHRRLEATFVRVSHPAGAFHLWRYLGGPWEKISEEAIG